jgi:hypothetical protein
MKPKIILCLALVLSGGLSGCSTTPPATGTKVYDYHSPDSGEVVVLKGLGNRLSVRVEADSWPAMIEKTRPTFAWNGRDMMWIGNDTNGQPQFVLDEAYIYQPTNQPLRWVLLDEQEAPFDGYYGDVMGNNLRGVATLQREVPVAHNDAGIIGEYAVVKSTNPRFGTVYEIGWQKLMANGTCLCEFNRRLYVLNDRKDRWHFLGEGPAEGESHYGGTTMESKVAWDNSTTNEFPLRIRFHSIDTDHDNRIDGDANSQPDVVTTNDYVMAGTFPAHFQRTK